jgi:Tat protein secretion system quality control protein TatD with DNase activity
MLIEPAAHLDYPDFAKDFDDVLRRPNEAGVTRIITICTHIGSDDASTVLEWYNRETVASDATD